MRRAAFRPKPKAQTVTIKFQDLLDDGRQLDPLGRLPEGAGQHLETVLQTLVRIKPGIVQSRDVERQIEFLDGHGDPVDYPEDSASFESFYDHAATLILMHGGRLLGSLLARRDAVVAAVRSDAGEEDWTWEMRDFVLRDLLAEYLLALRHVGDLVQAGVLPALDVNRLMALAGELPLARVRRAVTMEAVCPHHRTVDEDDPYGLEDADDPYGLEDTGQGGSSVADCCVVAAGGAGNWAGAITDSARVARYWGSPVAPTAISQNASSPRPDF